MVLSTEWKMLQATLKALRTMRPKGAERKYRHSGQVHDHDRRDSDR